MRIGLVGCVKSKLPRAAPARDLYISPLFVGRRRYVEESCDRWFILSAEHGLVDPERVLDPYDRTLKRATAKERRRWADQVVADLAENVGDLPGATFEVHAGAEYRDHGLVAGLVGRGARVENPTAGMPIGRQLAFYKSRAQ